MEQTLRPRRDFAALEARRLQAAKLFEHSQPQAEIVRRFGVSRPVILLWDGLPAHRSRLTRRALAGHRFWLRREPLPAYTPELNPVE